MPKNKLKIMTGTAMLTAFSIILERFLPIINTDTLRVSLGNIPIIIASIFFGPISGVVCGVVSDIIGCFLNGYPPFPVLTLAPVVVGLLPGISARVFGKRLQNGIGSIIFVASTLVVTNIIASLVITTAGLHMLYGTPIPALLLQRIPATAINTTVDIAAVYLILKNGTLTKLFGIR